MPSKRKTFNLSEELTTAMLTSTFRCSYAHLLEPWTGDPDKEPRYSVQCIFPKDDPWIKEAKERVKRIAIEAFGANAIKLMRSGKLKNPFRDGDLEFPDDPNYAGKVFFNANGARAGRRPPGLYDQNIKDIRQMSPDRAEYLVYSGCYARAEIKFYPYDEAGGKGVACFLFRVQIIKHGEPLAGGPPADKVFSKVEVDEDDVADFDDIDDDDDFEATPPPKRRGRGAARRVDYDDDIPY